MKPMKRKIILILTSIAIVVTAIYFYIDTVFLPIQLKQYIIKKAEKYLNRQVTIDRYYLFILVPRHYRA